MMNSNTIPSIFQSSAEKYKNRIVFNYFDISWKTMTYGEFFSLSAGTASFLMENGINRGDRIAIVSENRHEWCAAYMAILMTGGTAVPIDMQLGSEEIKNLLMDAEAKNIFYSSKTESNVLKVIEGTDIKGINLDGIFPEFKIQNCELNSLLVTPASLHGLALRSRAGCEAGLARYSLLDADDIASIIYTSGTTGKPKGVVLTHRNFCSDAEAVIQARVVTENDNVLSILPLHHTYPFMCTFLVPVFMGATITFSPGLKAAELISAIRDRSVTIAVGVPRLLEMIRNGIFSKAKEKKLISWIFLMLMRFSGSVRRKFNINPGKVIFKSIHKNFGTLKFFASGGARLEPSVMEDLEAMGFAVLEGYGLTETSPVVTFNPPEKRKPGSAGKPLPGVEIRIADDREIMIKGPMVMQGYYKNEEETRKTIKDGWLLTGDTGYMDKDGYLFVTGRKKEVIVLSSGKNIYPEDVEKAYMTIPFIKEICVIPTASADSIQAVIVPDIEYAKKALIGSINEALKWEINEVSMKLPEYMRVKGYTLHSEPLPRTTLGKLRRFMVNEMIRAKWEAKVKTEDMKLLSDETGRKVMYCIKALIKEDIPIQSADNLELDLGFDSLKKIELVSSLESRFSVSLPERFISEAQTVDDLIAGLKKYAAKEGGEDVYISWRDMLKKKPSREDMKKVGLSHNFVEMIIIFILFVLQKLIFKVFFGLTVKGRGNIPDTPFVITPNHVSFLDGFVIAGSVSFRTFRDLYFLGFQKYFTGSLTSLFARLSHVIPVDPETYLHRALQLSAYVIKNKKSMCIFPEGGRSFDGNLMEFKKGIGFLAQELDIVVVPTFIRGTFKAMPRGARFIMPAKIEVIFGKPLRVSDVDMAEKPEGVDEYQFFVDELRKRVARLSKNG